jgi:dTDP-4-dehydrorhamnose 3,5-epimerase
LTIEFSIVESEILSDVKIVTPSVYAESRGSVWTSYSLDFLGSLLPRDLSFKHDKFSNSYKNVLRGIHGDHKSWKLVSCIQGQIQQVVVDMRESSNTYLKSQSFDLGDQNKSMILIPPGMGNAFYVKSSSAIYHYKLAYSGEYIDADEQFTVSWNDPRLKIKWQGDNPILSERDMRA